MQSDYVVPEFKKSAFNCPRCNAYAQMVWENLIAQNTDSDSTSRFSVFSANCLRCRSSSYWLGRFSGYGPDPYRDGIMIYPNASTAPMPSLDLPDDCKADYLEARDIVSYSPRGAAALLRLVLQNLCKHLGGKGENINTDIGWLVKEKGLSPRIQKALDIVRVVGNNAVHPGELSLEEKPETAIKLFDLVNFIVEETITRPKNIDAFFSELPEGAKNGIEKRDGKTPPP